MAKNTTTKAGAKKGDTKKPAAAKPAAAKPAADPPLVESEYPTDIIDFMGVGSRLVTKKSKQGVKDFEAFLRGARLKLVANGEDAKPRKDCECCTEFMGASPATLQAALSECVECGKFQTFHNNCHYCMVLQSIYGV